MSNRKSVLTAPSGAVYHLNTLPAPMQKAAKADSLFLYRNRANLFFLRNLGDPLTTLAELRHWFGTIRQPSREQVKRAMILTVDEDYSIKAGAVPLPTICSVPP